MIKGIGVKGKDLSPKILHTPCPLGKSEDYHLISLGL